MKRLRSILKKTGGLLLFLLVIIQFFRPEKNTSDYISINKVSNAFETPLEVDNILERSCSDCHSNNSDYPWYTEIQPVSWWIDHHIEEGKEHFNSDEFKNYSVKRQHHVMDEIIGEIESGEMPFDSYVWLHPGTALSIQEKEMLVNWCKGIMGEIESAHPEVLEKK